MNLYLMRHGIAVAKDDPEIHSDEERALTKKGARKMRKAAKGLANLKVDVDRILTSPLPRSRQSAEIVAKVLDLEERLEDVPELTPEAPVQNLISTLSKYRGENSLLLIGHQPQLGKIASFLLAKNESMEIDFKKGGICRIEVADHAMEKAGVFHWMLTPKHLRKLRTS